MTASTLSAYPASGLLSLNSTQLAALLALATGLGALIMGLLFLGLHRRRSHQNALGPFLLARRSAARGGCGVAEVAVPALAAMEHVDVVGDGGSGASPAGERLPVHVSLFRAVRRGWAR